MSQITANLTGPRSKTIQELKAIREEERGTHNLLIHVSKQMNSVIRQLEQTRLQNYNLKLHNANLLRVQTKLLAIAINAETTTLCKSIGNSFKALFTPGKWKRDKERRSQEILEMCDAAHTLEMEGLEVPLQRNDISESEIEYDSASSIDATPSVAVKDDITIHINEENKAFST